MANDSRTDLIRRAQDLTRPVTCTLTRIRTWIPGNFRSFPGRRRGAATGGGKKGSRFLGLLLVFAVLVAAHPVVEIHVRMTARENVNLDLNIRLDRADETHDGSILESAR